MITTKGPELSKRELITAKAIVCLLSGKTCEAAAKELYISKGWVLRVCMELRGRFTEYFSEAKTNEISSSTEQGLKTHLQAMMKIVDVTDDELWFKAQRVPALAVFFRIIHDETIRVLTAIERDEELFQEDVPF